MLSQIVNRCCIELGTTRPKKEGERMDVGKWKILAVSSARA